ncbi:TPA: SMI1/KNR4 family protein [Vibrio alginolyticus]
MSIDWKLEISKLIAVKQVIAELDTQKLWCHCLPRLAASNEDIESLRNKIRKDIPSEYIEFLRFANGWPSFYQNVDLFGTSDYFNEDLMEAARDIFEQTSFSNDLKDDLLVIAMTSQDTDLFCLNLRSGEVIWFAGIEVERFDNFDEFFLTMVDYNREEIIDLENERAH